MKYRNKIILIGKYKFTKAYKCLATWGHSTAASATIIQSISLISLRLAFIGTPCPFLCCHIDEIITDPANIILSFSNWNVDTTHSPHSKNVPEPKTLPSTISFQSVYPADVIVDPKSNGKVDGYI